jgi:hypothetical protein
MKQMRRRWLLVFPLVTTLVACKPLVTEVGGARLPDADAVVEAPPGPTLVVGKDEIPTKFTGPVRLAADRDLPYGEVVAAVHAVRASGGTPYLLVVRRDRIQALPEPAPLEGEAIRLAARATGKACISPPGTEEATCISRLDQKRIDRAFVRQVLSKAVRTYRLTRINVVIEPELSWADAVRAIDGARTCCYRHDEVIVSVDPS